MIPNIKNAPAAEVTDDGGGYDIPIKKRGFRLFPKKETYNDEMLIETGSTTLLDIISPTSVDLTGRNHIEADGVFHAYLYITGYGYSTTVGNGWLSGLVEAGECQ